jgi:hypothetical protein
MNRIRGLAEISAVFCLVLFCVAESSLRAQTTVNATWNDGRGSWTTASDWNCPSSGIHCIPNNTSGKSYDAFFNNPFANLTLDGASSPRGITINALSFSGSLQVENGASLHVLGEVTGNTFENLSIANGGSVTVGGNMASYSLNVGIFGTRASGGGALLVDGNFVNDSTMFVESSTVTVGGTFAGPGHVYIDGGSGGAPGLLKVAGAAPSTLTGIFYLNLNTGKVGVAAVEYGSGQITQIGSGTTQGCCAAGSGAVTLFGSDAYMEVGATGSDTALSSLETIASNGSLDLLDGTSLTTTGILTNNGSLQDLGGTMTVRGNLINGQGYGIDLGTEYHQYPASLNVSGDLTNSGLIGVSYVGGPPSGPTTLTVGGNFTNSGLFGVQGRTSTATIIGQTDNSGTIILLGPMTANEFINTNAGSLYVGNTDVWYPGYIGSLTANDFKNAGLVDIQVPGRGASISLTVNSGGAYTQTAGTTDVDGTLMAPTVDMTGGELSGSGKVVGNVVNSGNVAPGDRNVSVSATTLTIDGNYTQQADGRLVIDISGTTGFDAVLDVTGTASLDGTAVFDFLDYTPGPNTDFTFLKAGSVIGDFTSFDFIGIKCPTCTFNLSTLSLDTGSMAPSTVPEPAPLVLLATGLLGLAWLARRKPLSVDRDSR